MVICPSNCIDRYYFLETCNGQIDVKVRDVKLHKSPVALKGLEIHLDVTFKIDSAKEDILHRLRDHIAQNYSTDRVEVPKAVYLYIFLSIYSII